MDQMFFFIFIMPKSHLNQKKVYFHHSPHSLHFCFIVFVKVPFVLHLLASCWQMRLRALFYLNQINLISGRSHHVYQTTKKSWKLQLLTHFRTSRSTIIWCLKVSRWLVVPMGQFYSDGVESQRTVTPEITEHWVHINVQVDGNCRSCGRSCGTLLPPDSTWLNKNL